MLLVVSAKRLNEDDKREGKFLGIFNIVTFPNNICNGTNDLQGICYSSTECTSKGGEASGSCASGFGTCCVFISKSDTALGMINFNTKIAYLQNPNFPQERKDALMQTIQLDPINENICQIRLDFLEFQMDGGSAIEKSCDRDMFQIIGGGGMNLGIGTLCGSNTNQHVYLPVQGMMGGPATIRIITRERSNGNISDGYKWNIKVTQVRKQFSENQKYHHGHSLIVPILRMYLSLHLKAVHNIFKV